MEDSTGWGGVGCEERMVGSTGCRGLEGNVGGSETRRDSWGEGRLSKDYDVCPKK
jgi:hypothetical protein